MKGVKVAWWAVILGGVTGPLAAAADESFPLFGFGSEWRYLDGGGVPDAAWTSVDFDDGIWKLGLAPLGYGEGDEATVVSYGPNPSMKAVTTYFRHTFVRPTSTAVTRLSLRLRADDGAVVYLNGVEIVRANLPPNTIDPATLATRELNPPEEAGTSIWYVWPGELRTTVNVLAVELHQASRETMDARFDAALIANLPLRPPEVRITSPSDGTVVLGAEVLFQTEVSDYDGYVNRVQFLEGTNVLGEVTSPPFDWIYEIAPGPHRVVAKAFDETSRYSVSDAVNVQGGAGNYPERLVRGPYLQCGTPTSITLCWRTAWLSAGVVRYGTDPENLDGLAVEDATRTDHEVTLEGLLPDTTYYYSIGTMNTVLQMGPDQFFRTAPAQARPTRIWVIGDSGTADDDARVVRDAFQAQAGGSYVDVWLMLGDNAYELGTDEDYQKAVFDMYPRILKQSVLWPTIGNHDVSLAADGGLGKIPYLDMFHLPTQGEAGGVASGTERYYSFDYSDIHFVCLDSAGSDRSKGGAMLRWLEEDLAATEKDWIIAFWHHPPYTFGTYDSDRQLDLTQIRQTFLPLLEAYGVDLVLCGHSHVYERSFLLNGHYGYSTNLESRMLLDGGSGNPAVDHAYQKPAGGLGAGQGTVYAVCGCSGEGGSFTFRRHPAMYTSSNGTGSLLLDIDGQRLEGRFLRSPGVVTDTFVIDKAGPAQGQQPRLTLRPTGNGVVVSWPTSVVPFRLEERDGLEEAEDWTPRDGPPPTQVGRRLEVGVPIEGPQRLFRLGTAD